MGPPHYLLPNPGWLYHISKKGVPTAFCLCQTAKDWQWHSKAGCSGEVVKWGVTAEKAFLPSACQLGLFK